jgi:2-keto-3-deoxy-L-rhamnonate aldolase RhmA
MKIEKGVLLRVQTTTKEDVFGECLYEVTEVGMDCPETGKKDGVRCVMLGGSGPAARTGFTVQDSETAINRNIAEGITTVVDGEKRDKILAVYKDKAQDGKPRSVQHGGSGVVEIE